MRGSQARRARTRRAPRPRARMPAAFRSRPCQSSSPLKMPYDARARTRVGCRRQTCRRFSDTLRAAMAKTPQEKGSMNWLQAIDEAAGVDEVLAVVEEFVDTRSEIYWMGVPEGMRQPRLSTDADLQRWHHGLVQAIKEMPSPGTPMQ